MSGEQEYTPTEAEQFIDPRDTRTIGTFTAAEFSNAWALQRGKVFDTNDLTPFHEEFSTWLAVREETVRTDERAKRPDREQFKAEAERRWPSYRTVGFSGADDRQSAFMAGVDAVLARLLDEPGASHESVVEAVRRFATEQRDEIRGRFATTGAVPANYHGYASACDDILGMLDGSGDAAPEAREDLDSELCGARAIGGSCTLKRAHNMGNLDIPSNHFHSPRADAREEPSVEEWQELVDAERARQVAMGYDDKHDSEHGIGHLLRWADDYLRRGEVIKGAALVKAARTLDEIEARRASKATAPEACEATDAEAEVRRVLAAARVLREAGDNAYLPDVAAALEAATKVK